MAPTGRKRRPPPYVLDALDRFAALDARRLHLSEFEMMMGVDWSRELTMRAVRAMEMRGWLVLRSGVIHITDEGAAAARGEGIVPPKKLPSKADGKLRTAKTRMPRGLF